MATENKMRYTRAPAIVAVATLIIVAWVCLAPSSADDPSAPAHVKAPAKGGEPGRQTADVAISIPDRRALDLRDVSVTLLDSSSRAPLANKLVVVVAHGKSTQCLSTSEGVITLPVGPVSLSPGKNLWFDSRELTITTNDSHVDLDCYGWIKPRIIESGVVSGVAVSVWVVPDSAMTPESIHVWANSAGKHFPEHRLRKAASSLLDQTQSHRVRAGADYLVACSAQWPVFLQPAHHAWRGEEQELPNNKIGYRIGAGSARGCPLSALLRVKAGEEVEVMVTVARQSPITLLVDCRGMIGTASATIYRLSPKGSAAVVNTWGEIKSWRNPHQGHFGSVLQVDDCPLGMYRFTGACETAEGITVMFKFFELKEQGMTISMSECVDNNRQVIVVDPSIGLPDGTEITWAITTERDSAGRHANDSRSVYFGRGRSPRVCVDGISGSQGEVYLQQVQGTASSLVPWDLASSPDATWRK